MARIEDKDALLIATLVFSACVLHWQNHSDVLAGRHSSSSIAISIHCTAKRQRGGGLRASHEWFFHYLVECYRECAVNSPCCLVGDFNGAAYEETIPNALRKRTVVATLLGQQQCCICCYSLGVPMNMNVKRTLMDTNRWRIVEGGMHEPLLLHLGNRPMRSEVALDKRTEKRDKRNAARGVKRKPASFR